MSTVVVDGANVVGSRPDGWWRDRAGAAARLHGQLLAAGLDGAEIVLVLEGQARAGVPIGLEGAVTTVHARKDGDSAIVALVADLVSAGRPTRVVTADRALGAAVERAGGTIARPSWLLDRLS